jgi:MFS family permease
MTAETTKYPSARRAWAFIFILFIASIVSVIDRSVLNIVIDPIKADIRITDVQISLLQGLAFGLFYAAVGIPLGLCADRYSRRWLIMIGMTLWGVATIAGGLAHTFGGLFLSRILVGLGEAALGPAAISLIADLFPPEKRGRPISFFLMGQSLALGLSISAAGFILQASGAGRFHSLPLLSTLAPWRVVFVLFGCAALVVIALMFTTREPVRRGAAHSGHMWSQIKTCVAYMVRNRAIFIPFYLGFSLYFAAAYGAGAWTPTMLMRGFGATGAQLAKWLGPLSLAFGVAGPLFAGFVADRKSQRTTYDARLRVLAIAPLAALPSVFAVFAPGMAPAMVLVASIGAVSVFIGTVAFAALQSMVPNTMRGVAIALTGLVNTILGAALGPLLVAELTQHVFHNPALVGYSIVSFCVPAILLGSGCFALSLWNLRRQLRAGGEVARLMAV